VGRKPDDLDVLVVGENTEAEVSSIRFADTARELVAQETVMTRVGVDRVTQVCI
jgi:tartrate dehydrogenase/decarboxylase/D-malate dehydrogenase